MTTRRQPIRTNYFVRQVSMYPKNQTVFAQDIEDKIDEWQCRQEDIGHDQGALLRHLGWTYTSSTPGAVWLWLKQIRGVTYLVNTETAIRMALAAAQTRMVPCANCGVDIPDGRVFDSEEPRPSLCEACLESVPEQWQGE